MSVPQIRRIALALVAGAALAAGSFAAETGAGLSFVNGSKRPMTILVRHGAEGECSRRPQVERLTVAPGETGTVEAAGGACYCLRPSDRRDICQDSWSEAKPGAQLQFK